MVCPFCQYQPLQVKNEHYFCPECSIYIGRATLEETKKPDHPVQNYFTHSHNFHPHGKYRAVEEALKGSPDDGESPYLPIYKKITKVSILFVFLVYLYTHYFAHIDFENKCYITIAPSWFEMSNATIKESLEVLKRASFEDYQYVCSRVNHIDPSYSCGGFGGGCYSQLQSRTIEVSSFRRQLVMTADIIVHEACHVKQRDEGRGFDEDECYKAGDGVLKKLVTY